MAEHLSLREIRIRLADPERIATDSFDILRSLCAYISTPDTELRAQDLLLRAMEKRSAFGPASILLEGMLRQVGLFPYLERGGLSLADNIAYEFHRPDNMESDGVVFHRVQSQVYDYLLAGDNVVLSAPTSFGKSLIIDAVIASQKYQNIVLVVPTIALIDETRRRLSRFSDKFKLITHSSQTRALRNLYIMTQERVLEQEKLEDIDFFVIDEFYKLQPRLEDADRSLLLNEAFYKLFKTGAQFYLLGPNVRGIDSGILKRLDLRFIKTDYKTVSSEIHHVKPVPDDGQALVALCGALKDPTLIYCSSPARVRKVSEILLKIQKPNAAMRDAVAWVGDNYSPNWLFAKALERGIGMHHGRLPRTLSQFVVRSFNEGNIRFLVCTSTLIEGVNTKAKNVIIFDNKIARRKFDYFTYNNILGRSGRMFQHFVGHVYIFHEPPAEELPFVDVPAFSQPDSAPESLLMQLQQEDLSDKSRDRMTQLSNESELEIDILRSGTGIDPRAQNRLACEIRSNAGIYWPLLSWVGFPNWDQLEAVSKLIWEYLVSDKRMRAGVGSGRQLAFKIDRFRRTKGADGLLKAELLQRTAESPDEVVEEVIDFLRSWCSFAFPRYLLAVNRIQHAVFLKMNRHPGDYVAFATQVENWFLPPALMALDEYGVPIQIGQKLQRYLLQLQSDSLDDVLMRLHKLDVSRMPLSDFEKSLVSDAQQHI
jgi:hypothetical protein